MASRETSEDRPEGPSEPGRRGSASGLVGWQVARVTGAFPTSVSFWLERDDGTAKIQILVRQRGEGSCLQSTPMGDVSYRQAAGLNEREAAQVTRGFARSLARGVVPIARYFPHLGAEAALGDDAVRLRLAQSMGPSIALLSDGRAGSTQLAERALPALLIFDPPGIAEFLAPEIAVDGSPLLGWVFRGVYLPSVARRQSVDFSAFVLEFTRQDREQSAQLTLRADGNETKAFGRCGDLVLSIAHDGETDAVPAEIASLASWVVALLRLKSSAALEVRVPKTMAELRAVSHPLRDDSIEARIDDDGAIAVAEDTGPPPALNLALDPDCGQHCVFCSVKSYVTPTDAGTVDLDDVQRQLQRAQRLGVQEVRLNGIDPLQHSRVLDVLDAIRSLGFPKLTVYSPGRRLADAAFRKEFLQRVPAQLKVSVPLYGLTAATHDTVTGSPGSHREVMEAIAGLRAEAAPDALQISTIFVKQNVHEIVPMLRWLRKEGLDEYVHAHLPYPMRPTTRDPYVDSAMRETELMQRLLVDVRPLGADERSWVLAVVTSAFRHPCVRWQAEASTGLPVLGAEFPDRVVPLAGTEYRSGKFVHASGTAGEADAFAVAVVECPHIATCALAAVCPGEHYSVYAERYGLGEFTAVTPADLYWATPTARPPKRGAGVWSMAKAALRSRQR